MKKKIYSHIVKNLITKLFLVIVKFGTTVVTSRFLGIEGRGVFVIINQIVGISNSLVSLSCGEGFIYYLSKYQNFKKKIFFIVLSLILFFSFISGLTLFTLDQLVENKNINKNLSNEFKLIILVLILPVLTEYFLFSVFKGFKLFDSYNKFSILGKLILLISIIASLFLQGDKILNCLIFFTFAYYLNFILYFFYFFRISIKKAFYKMNDLFKILKFSSKVHLINFLTEFEYKVDHFVILFFLDIKSIGIYSIAVAIAQLVFYITNSINTIIYPYISSNLNKKTKTEVVLKMANLSFLSTLIILFPITITGNYLFPLVFGSDFASSYEIFLILATGLLAESICRIIVTWFKGLNKANELVTISASCILLNIFFNILLIPYIGLVGAALSSVLSYWIRLVLILFKFKTYIRFNIFILFKFNSKEISFLIKLLKKKVFSYA